MRRRRRAARSAGGSSDVVVREGDHDAVMMMMMMAAMVMMMNVRRVGLVRGGNCEKVWGYGMGRQVINYSCYETKGVLLLTTRHGTEEE